jgi:hypothetical protein
MIRTWTGIGTMCLVLLAPSSASADADDEERASRFGLVASVGGGVAGVLHPGPLTGSMGFTDIGAEIFGEVRPWGGFVRADFLSSGDSARWTSYSFAAGTQYRLFGTVHSTALFLRGGLVYERMLGNNAGCPIIFFFPSSCNLLNSGTAAPTFSATGDMLGLLLGARVELPVPVLYVAVGASFVPTVDVDASRPAGTFELRFDLELGLRDERTDRTAVRTRTPDELRRRRQ